MFCFITDLVGKYDAVHKNHIGFVELHHMREFTVWDSSLVSLQIFNYQPFSGLETINLSCFELQWYEPGDSYSDSTCR